MNWEIIDISLTLIVSGILIAFGIIFVRSALVASKAREHHAYTSSGTTAEVFFGDKPKVNVTGREEAFQEGMSYDRKSGKIIPQATLSSDYIDSLIG